MRRLLSRIATPRGRAQFVGGVSVLAGLVLALADSRHWILGAAVLVGGALLWLVATSWVRLSMAEVRTAVEHGATVTAREPEPQLPDVARFVRTELRSIQSRVAAYRREEKFSRGIHPLPAQRWEEYRAVLARRAPEAYDEVQDVYVRADALNHLMVERANLYIGPWLNFHDDDGLDELEASLAAAIARLDDLAR